MKNGKSEAVLTGSTNFSRGGVFGQSNVVHIVENAKIAGAFLKCWELISANPSHDQLRASLTGTNQIPEGLPPKRTFAIFSPQQTKAALDWYAKLAKNAQDALFMTFAFGVSGAPNASEGNQEKKETFSGRQQSVYSRQLILSAVSPAG